MATRLGIVNLTGCSYELAYDLLSQSVANNSSTVRLYGILHVTNNYVSWSRGSASVHTSGLQAIGTYYARGDHTVITRDFTFGHNSSGDFSTYIGASLSTTFVSGDCGGTLTLPRIPRYANINSFTVSKRDETSLTFSFSASATIDYIWYSTNGGSSWTGRDITDGTSASFAVTGLTANTSYTCKLRVRRRDSQLTTDSNNVSQTTYNYPYITAVGTSNLIIGNSQKLTLYNPLSRSVTVRMYKTNTSGTQLYSGSTSSTSFTFTPTASTLYASIPNDTYAKCVYSVIYGSVVKTTGQYTYTINANNCKPTFNDFEYSTNYDDLTGDTETIINGKTNTTITISSANKAVGKNSATILRYSLECGSSKNLITYSDSDVSGLLQNCNSDIIRVTAIDSRGLETTVTKTVPNFKNYYIPTFASTSVERKDGIEDIVNLDAEMNFWNYSFGDENNAIVSLKYRSKEKSASEYGEWYNVRLESLVIDKEKVNIVDYLIYTDGIDDGFTVGVAYDVQLEITDKLSSSVSNAFTLVDGTVALSILKDSNGDYHIGINGMPDLNKTLKVHGTIENS